MNDEQQVKFTNAISDGKPKLLTDDPEVNHELDLRFGATNIPWDNLPAMAKQILSREADRVANGEVIPYPDIDRLD